MTKTLSSESADWVSSIDPQTFSSTIPNYEESPPFRVHREGAKNYVKNRGTLNIGDWAIEGRRMSTTTLPNSSDSNLTQPKVLGSDALKNYTKSRCSTPNLIGGYVESPDAHHNMRVKKEGRANYEKNHNTEMKGLLNHYGKLSLPKPPVPHTQGELATSLFYAHYEGQMGSILNSSGSGSGSNSVQSTPRPMPHIKGIDAATNLQKGYGDSQLLNHGVDPSLPTREPHIKGDLAQLNYDMGQGHNVNDLFHQYGRIPQSARAPPKVKYGGVENLRKGQGDEMRKTLSQCPPTTRLMTRPPSAPYW